MMKHLKTFFAALPLVMAASILALWLKPPALLRVGANYSAKIVCSNVFLAGRGADEVLRADVQAPGIALLELMRVSVDRPHGVVRAGFFGFIGDGLAIYRPGRGCTVLPDGKRDLASDAVPGSSAIPASGIPPASGATPASAPASLWPEGVGASLQGAMTTVLNDDALAGPGMRALIVVDHGRLVGERYAPGFGAVTPLLGWSMTKTVMAGVIGMLVKDGRLSLTQTRWWPASSGDKRLISLADLLAMSSGLHFNESYGAVSDVTDMLFLEPDMAAFARAQPLDHPIGEHWSYSSGTAVILSRIVQDTAGSARYVAERLFAPLGMTSAVIEPDERGTLVGSSYMYATARDWARYGEFLVQDGVWQGQALLPQGYVAMMATPVASSLGQYGHGQVWLWGSDAKSPGVNPDTPFGIPPDTFYLSGHDGQTIAVIRSRQLVLVRLGLTPYTTGFSPQPLLKAVLEAQAGGQ